MIPDLSEFFKALGDTTRQRIINLLLNYPSLNVNDLCHILNEPQSKISRHLMILRHADWLVFNRRDKWVFYKINPDIPEELLRILKVIFQQYLQMENDLNNARSKYR